MSQKLEISNHKLIRHCLQNVSMYASKMLFPWVYARFHWRILKYCEFQYGVNILYKSGNWPKQSPPFFLSLPVCKDCIVFHLKLYKPVNLNCFCLSNNASYYHPLFFVQVETNKNQTIYLLSFVEGMFMHVRKDPWTAPEQSLLTWTRYRWDLFGS